MTGAIKRMFKAAAKAFAARDDEPQVTPRKRKGGEKEGGGPILTTSQLKAGQARALARRHRLALRALQKQRPRPSSKKEGSRPVMQRPIARHVGRLAARGRYRRLRPLAVTDDHGFAKAAAVICDIAEAVAVMFEDLRKGMEKVLRVGTGLYLTDTLDWLNQWSQESATIGHGLDDHFDTQQNQNSPHL
jgi:hypothetical protein